MLENAYQGPFWKWVSPSWVKMKLRYRPTVKQLRRYHLLTVRRNACPSGSALWFRRDEAMWNLRQEACVPVWRGRPYDKG